MSNNLNLKTFLWRGAMLLLCALPALAPASFAQVKLHAPCANKNVSELSFLAGKWKTKNANSSFEEHWMAPADGSMIGMGREMDGNKMQFHEYLRIEQRKDGIFYVAQPMGKAPTDFRLTNENTNTLMFENPEHDFPKVITYEKRIDGSLCITVSGNGPKKNKSFQHILLKE